MTESIPIDTSLAIPTPCLKGGTTLLLVDMQNDFHPGGSLAIPTANDDAKRISSIIRRSIKNQEINRIVATLDSHHKLHIAHPSFWVSGEDGLTKPSPFTIISSADVESKKWKPRNDLKLPVDEVLVSTDILGAVEVEEEVTCGTVAGGYDLTDYFYNLLGGRGGNTVLEGLFDANGNLDILKYSVLYTKLLEQKGRFHLCIWPEHCIIGTKGHGVVDSVMDAILDWSDATGGSVQWVMKGQNLLTEMYSAFQAEVPISPNTSFNARLHQNILQSDRILVAGQAMSHCVNYTARDLVDKCPPNQRHKICILTDCASSVPGFESVSSEFLKYMKDVGVNLCTASEAFD